MTMVVSRALVMLCVAAAVVLSEAPGAGAGAELVKSPLRHLEEEVVKVHVKVHQKKAAAAKEHSHKYHKKEEEEKEVSENGESVRNYDHGTVRIESSGAKAAKKYGMDRHQKNAAKKAADDETVVEYKHGSIKISDKKESGATDSATKNTKGKAKKGATANEKEVTSTVNEVNKLMTELSSTSSTNKKSFHDAYGPVVVICGIIGGLAAIIGVAGLVMEQPQSNADNLDSVLAGSADLDVDVEANITQAGVQDAAGDGDNLVDDSDSDCIDDEDEEEGTFANGTAHVSV